MENLLKYFFPTKCLFCSKQGYDLCPECLSRCKELEVQRCVVCDLPASSGMPHLHCSSGYTPILLFSAFEYAGLCRACIKKAKYNSREFNALKLLSDAGARLFSNYIKLLPQVRASFDSASNCFTVISAPISNTRLRQRGFNQADLIAERVQKELMLQFSAKINYSHNVVFRSRHTEAQHQFTREARFLNVKDAFSSNSEHVKGRTFILVDDITTTGATLLEIAKELYNKGATAVMCFALSKKLKAV